MVIEDPIVDEVREARERLMAEAGGFDDYVRKLKSLEADDAIHIVDGVKMHREWQKHLDKNQFLDDVFAK